MESTGPGSALRHQPLVPSQLSRRGGINWEVRFAESANVIRQRVFEFIQNSEVVERTSQSSFD